MIVLMPRPSSPTRYAQAESNSTSLEALERLPILSFKRWIKNLFFSPEGVHRGRKKQESPLSVCAKIRKASHMGAEQNHLWPVMKYSRELPMRTARVVLANVRSPLLLCHAHAQ